MIDLIAVDLPINYIKPIDLIMENQSGWTPEDEALYLEERKYSCETCEPEHHVTIEWLKSAANQDLVETIYKSHGIPPHIIYKEFEAELTAVQPSQEVLEEFMEELA